ncbi:hypothetical protein [Thauera sp. WH-1]|uniref:SLAC1 family transporter n=1 Tax=Thauera sp. WH-1 TaxID=3398230 RepID=UPI0039FCF230
MNAPASSTTPAAAHDAHCGRLAHFPVALLSTVMGIAGLTIAWFKAHHTGGGPVEIGVALRWLASNALRFFRLPFFISAWAYSFPLGAMTIATFEMSARSGQAFYAGLSWLMLAVLSAVVALLAFKTLRAASRGQICVPE